MLYKSYQPGHLRKKDKFRDTLVVPTEVQCSILHALHDHKVSGHLAFKHTFDWIRNRFWWPTLHKDV
ncbi:unnamed protein product [Choristocarpus tenellus]